MENKELENNEEIVIEEQPVETAEQVESQPVEEKSSKEKQEKPAKQDKSSKNKKKKEAKTKSNKAKELVSELKKVTWPSFKEVVKKTGVVLAVVAIFFVVLFGIDRLLSFLFELLTKAM